MAWRHDQPMALAFVQKNAVLVSAVFLIQGTVALLVFDQFGAIDRRCAVLSKLFSAFQVRVLAELQ